MTTIEDRTRLALHGQADALVVTDGELNRMEEDIMTLLDTRPGGADQARRRRWTWVAAAAAVAVVGAGAALWTNGRESAAPLPASSPTTSATIPFDPALVGLWRYELDGQWLWTFTDDGRVTWFDSAQGMLHGSGELRPVIARNGDTYDVLQQPGNCVVRILVPPPARDSTVIRVVHDECPGGYDAGSEGVFERVSGRAASSPALEPLYPVGVAEPATALTRMAGTWVDPATGTVLALALPSWAGGDAEYLLDDDGDGLVSPDQRGRVTMTPSGAVQPVPAPGTVGTCAPVFTKVVADTATLTTTAGPGGCFPEGSTTTWFSVT